LRALTTPNYLPSLLLMKQEYHDSMQVFAYITFIG
jgi:hypothetical protein